MKKILITLVALMVIPAAAMADSIVGAQLQIIPGGELETEAFGIDAEGELETAYGLAVIGEYIVHKHVTVGLAPRVAFGLKLDEDADDSSTQLDLPLRATGRLFFGKIAVHGYLALGYSIIFVPDPSEDIDLDNPSGFLFGLGFGAAYQLGDNLAFSAELGYAKGSQSVEIEGGLLGDETVDFATSLPHFAIGVHTVF